MQCILYNPNLSLDESTWEFLKSGSERFEDCLHPREHRGLGREISRKVFSVMGNTLEATSSVGQGVVDSVIGGNNVMSVTLSILTFLLLNWYERFAFRSCPAASSLVLSHL